MALWYALNDPVFDTLEKTLDCMLHDCAAPASKGQGKAVLAPSQGRLVTAGRFDVVERSDAFEFVTDAPGFTPEDISVELKEGVLTISGKHQEQREHQPSDQQTQDQVKVWRRERHVQQFSRSFKLPDNAKPEDISANLDKGVLTVQVPKLPPAPKPEPRRIAVQGAPAVAA